MPNFIASNLSRYQAISTSDAIPDGYIKATEKVWLDSFTFTSVITTADTIAIAVLPVNKRITGVEVYLPATFAPTSCTISVGVTGSMSLLISSSTSYVVGNAAATGSTVMVNNKVTMNNLAGFQYVTTATKRTIYLSLGVANTAPTAGTILTKVTYT